MSILMQVTQTTPAEWAMLTILMIAALIGGWIAGVFHGGWDLDATRMRDHPRYQPPAMTFLVGFAVFFLAQIGCGLYLHSVRTPPGEPFDMNLLTAADWALLASLPATATLLSILAMQRTVFGTRPGTLGLRIEKIPAGLLAGLVAILITLPLILWFSAVIEHVYKRIGYQHPMEHDLLRVLPQAQGWIKGLMLVAITVLAPVSEELLFRGNLQTGLRRLLMARNASATSSAWGAIVLTSVVFAIIHPLWSAPPIFLLSLALGYAYERTGNLWTVIFMHSLFNASSTVLYFAAPR